MKDKRYIDDPALPDLPLFAHAKVEQVMGMIDDALFNHPSTGENHPETSFKAAKVAGRTAKTLRAGVFKYISSRGDSGATANEVHLHFDMDKNSTSPRITELKQAGVIFDSGERRAGDGCGSSIVWRSHQK